MLGNYDLIPLIPPVKIFLGKFLFLPQPPSLLGNFPFWLITMASLRQLTIIWGWPQRSKGSRRSAWAPVTTLHSPRNWVPVAPNSVFFYCNSHESLVRTPVSTSIKGSWGIWGIYRGGAVAITKSQAGSWGIWGIPRGEAVAMATSQVKWKLSTNEKHRSIAHKCSRPISYRTLSRGRAEFPLFRRSQI